MKTSSSNAMRTKKFEQKQLFYFIHLLKRYFSLHCHFSVHPIHVYVVTMQSPSKSLEHEWRTKGTSTKSSITLAKVHKLKKKQQPWNENMKIIFNETQNFRYLNKSSSRNATEHSNDVFIFLVVFFSKLIDL